MFGHQRRTAGTKVRNNGRQSGLSYPQPQGHCREEAGGKGAADSLGSPCSSGQGRARSGLASSFSQPPLWPPRVCTALTAAQPCILASPLAAPSACGFAYAGIETQVQAPAVPSALSSSASRLSELLPHWGLHLGGFFLSLLCSDDEVPEAG